MNTITNVDVGEEYVKTQVGRLVGDNLCVEKTAFVGKVGRYHVKNKLWLVTYDCIALAEDPTVTFSYCSDTRVSILRWVDLVITVK